MIDDQLTCLGGDKDSVKVFDFNYVCVTVMDEMAAEELQIQVNDDIVLHCRFENEIRKGLRLYSVLNYREIVDDSRKRHELLDWLVEKSGKSSQREREVMTTRSEKTGEFDEIGLLGGR